MTMPSEAVAQFLEQGKRSGLFCTAQEQDLIAQLTADSELGVDEFAARLIEKQVLTSAQAEQLLAGPGDDCVFAGRYRVLHKLGEGGMGAVYKAHDTQLDRLVALKVLPAGRLYDPDAIARFQREAKALARLSYPHIVQAYDSGQDNGRPFLVMEYLEGATLDQVLRQQGAVAPTRAADMIHQAALGLQHAHEKGLIHRDLKPANLHVAGRISPNIQAKSAVATVDYKETPGAAGESAGRAIVKILDLGLARFLQDQLGEAQLTQEGMGIGTPDYMAPEQFRDARHADARTDVYGLGCTLYHLIAGQVPFPGSSYTEKAQAHTRKEPIPLEERCPELPGGLAFVVAKAMAKHPAERFQTAGAFADALTPFVAGGSHSMIRLRQTGTWQHGQLTMSGPRRVKQVLTWTAGVIAVVAFLGLLVLAWPNLFGPGASKDLQGQVQPPDTNPTEPSRPRVVTIANGLTVAQDGSGQFPTISAALAKVKPGQTIHVLDRAVYQESLSIGSRGQQSGITLEGVNRPTIVITAPGAGILIASVPGVTIRGFRLLASAPKINLIHAKGLCPGLILDDLEMDSNPGGDYTGVGLITMNHSNDDPPVVVRNCLFRHPRFGIEIKGIEDDYKTPSPCVRVIVRDNVITDPILYGILVRGLTRQIHIVGNRIRGTTGGSALQIDMVKEGSDAILFANNTIHECTPAFRVWDDVVRGTNVQFRNNLILGSAEGDMRFIARREGDFDFAGPADGTLIGKAWRLDHNGREGTKPNQTGLAVKGWIPTSSSDVIQNPIEVLSRDPDNPNFLRPAKNSPLASRGAGGDLPTYIGAVAPEGVAAWDWQKTWESRHPRMLLTVSKDAKDEGEFQTIKAALDKVDRPGMTIRVLDGETYAESILITKRSQHEGLTLEAVKGATMVPPSPAKAAIAVVSVPGVTVRGFRLRTERENVYLCAIIGLSGPTALPSYRDSQQQVIRLRYRHLGVRRGKRSAHRG